MINFSPLSELRVYGKRNVAARSPSPSATDPLEKRYRVFLSGAVVAKAHFLAVLGRPDATRATVERARWKWERIDLRRRSLATQLMKQQDSID